MADEHALDNAAVGEALPEADATHRRATLVRALDAARRELLDLSGRNRLLNTSRRRERSSSIEIVQERGEDIYDLLVRNGKSMSFEHDPEAEKKQKSASAPVDDETAAEGQPTADLQPAASAEEVTDAKVQPDDAPDAPDGIDSPDAADRSQPEPEAQKRLRDSKLQTPLTSSMLQKRLLRLYYDARTFQEEQGVNILFLAIGFLKWRDNAQPDRDRFAPLLLVPVELQRQSARGRFRVAWTGEEITTNLSLQVKLKADCGIELPDVPDHEDLAFAAYFADVETAIAGADEHWEVLRDDIVLWFFSFAKLLMYRDLDPANWPAEKQLDSHPLIQGLLVDGFTHQPGLREEHSQSGASAEMNIDALLSPRDMVHVVNADSSQTLAIEEARLGRNLVIQGPPGTGKSQTIANVIAASVAAGKRVLFVAEKVAALDVVKRRLEKIGLGDMCLALHSHNAKKRLVLDDLGRTLALERPVKCDVGRVADDLAQVRSLVNEHAARMHTPVPPGMVTPFRALGELVRLRNQGVPAVELDLHQPLTWSPDEREAHRHRIVELLPYLEDIGTPADHAWRGVQRASILPTDVQRLEPKIREVRDAVARAQDSALTLAQMLHVEPPHSCSATAAMARTAQAICQRPPIMDRNAYRAQVWATQRNMIPTLTEALQRRAAAREQLAGVVNEQAWTTDVREVRDELATRGRSLLRFLSGAYRRAKRTLAGVLAAKPPKALEARLAICDAIMQAQEAEDVLKQHDAIGRAAFGSIWQGAESDPIAIGALVEWDARSQPQAFDPGTFRAIAAAIEPEHLASLRDAATSADAAQQEARAALADLFHEVKLDVSVAFCEENETLPGKPEDVPLAHAEDRLREWLDNPEGISKWIAAARQLEAVQAAGLDDLAARLCDGRISPGNVIDRFDMAYYEAVLRNMIALDPHLASFNGLTHEQLLDRFGELDEERIRLAAHEVALAHYERIPRGLADIGELGIVRHELNKKRRHLPIRQLLRRAGDAITRIKPVFMMSPLSIAQYVEPGSLDFDILLIDEASQIRPVDALGAIARARQIVVVGDDKQLPPTRFFHAVLNQEGVPEEDVVDALSAGDLESILGLCDSRGIPSRMLRWHYRSRHHSLIAVSNREFYDNQLYVIPSPGNEHGRLGVRWRFIEDGIFDRGKTATNAREADAIAEAVMQHARENSKQTLGVGAFSVSQRDAILDRLETLRRSQPEVESFFDTSGAEPFFVKNLENIQGDERDVIFISIGYAPDESRAMSMNFGPLSNDGGERRLNVLITRARDRCVVFSSITPDQIDLSRATGRGPAALRAFLSYVQAGSDDRPMQQAAGMLEQSSVFERALAASLEEAGYIVDARIGVAGSFVDLAVRHPDDETTYVLGIECDGPSYAAARSARDRDRTWSAVLRSRGWALHRIWAIDWFNRPEEQSQQLIEAIETARMSGAGHTLSGSSANATTGIARQDSGESRDDATGLALMAVPYVEAKMRVPKSQEIHELPVARLLSYVTRVVEVEQPIHLDELVTRIRTLWDMSRAGSRMQRAVQDAVNDGLARGELVLSDASFLSLPDGEVRVRDRSDVESSSLRSVAMLPPEEIRTAVLALLAHHIGVTRDEVAIATARALGYRSTSAQLREVIDSIVDELIRSGSAIEADGKLGLPVPE